MRDTGRRIVLLLFLFCLFIFILFFNCVFHLVLMRLLSAFLARIKMIIVEL